MTQCKTKYDGYALITGGSSGIGLAFAKQLAEQGYNLVLVARKQEELKKAQIDIKTQYSVDVVTISEDLSNPESTDNIYNQLQMNNIQIGLLVNNAGFGKANHFEKIDRAYQQSMIRVMCSSYTDLTFKFLPSMLKKKSGGIIFLSSSAALSALPFFSVYGAAKAFVLQFGRSLNVEVKRKGIDVLTVCPSPVNTNFYPPGVPHPPGKSFMPDEIAQRSIKALGKKSVLLINSPKVRFLLFLTKFLPSKWIDAIAYNYMQGYLEKDNR